MKRIFKLSSIALLTILSSQVFAAGYKLEFQSTSVLADGGDAAVVEDVGTNWYNSAGLVYLPQQFVFSAIAMYQPVTFSGSVTAPSVFPAPFGSNFSGSGQASSHNVVGLPAFHYGLPFKDRYAFGISVVPAWGLLEDYGDYAVTRYNLARIYTRTIDIAPSFAMKINDQWSFGVGPDIHYFALQSKNHVRTEGAALVGGTPNDSISRVSTQSWNYGAHIGILYRPNQTTRIGLNYRSKITQQLDGYSDFSVNGGSPTYETNQFKLTLPMPPTTSLSAYHDLSAKWAIMGTIAYDQWSVVKQLHGRNYIQPPIPPSTTPRLIGIVIPQDLHDTLDFTIGGHYTYNERLMLRGSLKYEPTPTNNRYRDINFPDGEKLGLNIGARYQFTPKIALDLLYAHVFVNTMPINVTAPVTNVYTNGRVHSKIDLAGAQLVWNI